MKKLIERTRQLEARSKALDARVAGSAKQIRESVLRGGMAVGISAVADSLGLGETPIGSIGNTGLQGFAFAQGSLTDRMLAGGTAGLTAIVGELIRQGQNLEQTVKALEERIKASRSIQKDAIKIAEERDRLLREDLDRAIEQIRQEGRKQLEELLYEQWAAAPGVV